jgi:hypothetical protein
VQAFAEALGLVSDIELHLSDGPNMRLQSITSLLSHAIRQYVAAVECGDRSGLNKYHEKRLQQAGLNSEGIRRVLHEASNRGFLKEDNGLIEKFATASKEVRFSELMSLYIAKIREIYDLAAFTNENEQPSRDPVALQELSWKITALFAQALEVGKAIAILNIFTFRLPSGVLPFAEGHSKSVTSSI